MLVRLVGILYAALVPLTLFFCIWKELSFQLYTACMVMKVMVTLDVDVQLT